MSLEELDCSGKESAMNECWPTWVNVGVPVIISAAFLFVLAIMFIVWPKESPEEQEEEEGDRYKPGTWIPNDGMLEVGGASNHGLRSEASSNHPHQVDENIV